MDLLIYGDLNISQVYTTFEKILEWPYLSNKKFNTEHDVQ